VKKEKNNKRDMDEVESNDSKEEHDENAVLTTPNKKIQILEPLTDETIE
jgi:hypothetical protein